MTDSGKPIEDLGDATVKHLKNMVEALTDRGKFVCPACTWVTVCDVCPRQVAYTEAVEFLKLMEVENER